MIREPVNSLPRSSPLRAVRIESHAKPSILWFWEYTNDLSLGDLFEQRTMHKSRLNIGIANLPAPSAPVLYPTPAT